MAARLTICLKHKILSFGRCLRCSEEKEQARLALIARFARAALSPQEGS